jgi:hypothetical protein
MAKTIKNKNAIPSLDGYGGVRALQKKMERSKTLAANREAITYSMLSMANATLLDVMEWDESGVRFKNSKDIPDHVAQAIKEIKFDNEGRIIDIKFQDKPAILRLLAKASGMLDNQDESDKPSVIGINVKAPEIIDIETDDGEQEEVPAGPRGSEDEDEGL